MPQKDKLLMKSDNEALKRLATVTPSKRQIEWQKTEFYAFIHFGINTFTDREWGFGKEDPRIFNPEEFDTDQWARACKSAKMRGIIITAKHHDGFCLWPSAYTGHSVKSSDWRGGKGDIVKELSESCRKYGLKFGIYLSPWDRHEESYGDSERYNDFFVNQLTELLTNYGELFTVWFDGACGEGKNGKTQIYDWERYYSIIRKYQPNACINVCGPDVRWCGNEAGICRESEWSVVSAQLIDNERTASLSQKADDGVFICKHDTQDSDLGSREKVIDEAKLAWYPAEVNTSIRPGWFYHESQDDQVRSVQELKDIYICSVGGNATFLLNIPPDRRGLFHENDVKALEAFGKELDKMFSNNVLILSNLTNIHSGILNVIDGNENTFWASNANETSPSLIFEFKEQTRINLVELCENIQNGQRIESFSVDIRSNGTWKNVFKGTVIGYKKICRFESVGLIDAVKVTITESRWIPELTSIKAYNYDEEK